jgi:monovalent cation:H+ antiporter-2, CPA2 family
VHALIAAGAAPDFFVEIALLVIAGAVIGYLSQRLGLVPIVGFLVAGAVIGPHALGLVADREMADAAAEVGVVLLLFTIGIEFSLEKLARIRRLIFLGGGLQVLLATAATAGLCLWLGAGWRAAVFTGLLVSLSSTVIVLKLLADRGETAVEHGQVGLGLLIFQDLAIVAMVLLVPSLGASGDMAASGAEVAWAAAKAVAIIVLVLVLARRLLPAVLERVAALCAPEVFLLTVMALCFGTAWLTSLAGVSLSLGAFLAGLMVSESRFSEHAFSEILPLQIVFSALFFISVGMLLDLRFLLAHLPMILAAVAVVLVVKVVTTGVSVAVLGGGVPVAAASALMLAQVGEFSFVLERAGREAGLTPAGLGADGSQGFIAATVLLMVATPPLTSLGVRLAGRLGRAQGRREARRVERDVDVAAAAAALPRLENHVVVAGYGTAARRLVRVLRGSGVPFVVTTLSPGGADEAEAEGVPVLRGDAGRRPILEHAGVERAKMLVIADDDPATARRVAAVARPLNPTLRIVVRTRRLAEVEPLSEAGVDRVIPEELESIVALFDDVLVSYRVSPREVAEHDAALRRGSYALLRAPRPRLEAAAPLDDWECDLGPDCFDSRLVTVRAGAPAAGLAWEELRRRLREEHAVDATGLRRGGRDEPAPAPDLLLEPGDEVVLMAPPARFAGAGALFRSPREEEEMDDHAERPRVVAAAGTTSRGFLDTEATVELHPADPSLCAHLDRIRPMRPGTAGCEECLASGDRWVHLRLCMTCGHVGCCDSSPNRHATAHFHATGHPVVRSVQPGEEWGWCYLDEQML